VNILLTCVGLRVDNVVAYRDAIAAAGLDGEIIGTDASEIAPALHFCDRYTIAPRVADPGYARSVLDLVERHAIRMVVPLSDLDIVVLAGLEDELAARGAIAWVPEARIARMCVDKFLMAVWLEEHGFATPRTFLPQSPPEDLVYPVLVKMREGSGSANIFRAADARELAFFTGYATVPVMIQELCTGEELSSDLFCDRRGRMLNVVSRTMGGAKGGEQIKGETFVRDDLTEYLRRVAETMPLRGPACIQVFETAPGRFEITDINPRTGGGFPLPLAAARSPFPELAVRIAAGETIEPHVGEIETGLILSRFFHQVVMRRSHGRYEVDVHDPVSLPEPRGVPLEDPESTAGVADPSSAAGTSVLSDQSGAAPSSTRRP
jgi:carbamoyl-phosphate synthase large subunit